MPRHFIVVAFLLGFDMIHHIYKITNIITGEYYIGKHTSISPYDPYTDPYMGSGNWILKMKNDDPCFSTNYTKTIIDICDSEYDLNEKEIFHISKVRNIDPLNMNISYGGSGFATKENNLFYNDDILEWYHAESNITIKKTRQEMQTFLSVRRSDISNTIYKTQPSVKGWVCLSHVKRNTRQDNTLYAWYIDGNVVNMTKGMLSTSFGIPIHSINKAIRSGTLHYAKHALFVGDNINCLSLDDINTFLLNKTSNATKKTCYDWININNGIVECGMTQQYMIQKYKLTPSKISNVVNDKVKSHKGWKINK